MRTIWVCEHCGNESEDKDKIYACEASHYGLTVMEMKTWNRLKELARQAGYNISFCKNETTEKEFDDVIQRLVRFEDLHHL